VNAISSSRSGDIAWIVLDRQSRRNALRSADLEQLAGTMRGLSVDRSVRVVCITGAGGHFSGGADIEELQRLSSASSARANATLGQAACDAIEQSPVPVIAAIEGYCVGGGLEIAMACDFRLADAQARFGQVELGIGSIAAWGGIRRLPRLVGVPWAKRMVYTAQHLDANQALAVGLVDEVVQGTTVQAAAEALAAELARSPREAVAASKRALDQSVDVPLYAGLQQDRETFAALVAGQEFQEGVAAFLSRSSHRRQAVG